MKLIVPLLDDNITTDAISKEAGFVDAYTWNKNEPYIDNCIFLMYDATIINNKTRIRDCILYNSPNLYKKKYVTVKGHYYSIYAMSITNPEIREFLQGLRHKKNATGEKIMSFWAGKDK